MSMSRSIAESRLRASSRIALPSRTAAAQDFAAEEQIGRDVEARHQVELLIDGGDAGRLRFARISEGDHSPSISISPSSGAMHARKNVHQRRLAGAVLAEQRMDFAGVEREIDAAQRLRAAKALTTPRAARKGAPRPRLRRVHVGGPQELRARQRAVEADACAARRRKERCAPSAGRRPGGRSPRRAGRPR